MFIWIYFIKLIKYLVLCILIDGFVFLVVVYLVFLSFVELIEMGILLEEIYYICVVFIIEFYLNILLKIKLLNLFEIFWCYIYDYVYM